MEKDKELEIYDIVVDYEDKTGFIRNSFVANPAVEYERFAFSKFDNFYFQKNDSEQKFISISMVADTPILRKAEDGTEFYVRFSRETIKKIVNKLVMENKTNEASWQHSNEILDDVFLVEHFILEKGRVESPLFLDAPDGSWVTTYWVKDKKKYEELKNDPEFRGFSIEINAKIKEAFTAHISEEKLLADIKDIVFNETLSDEEKEGKLKKVLNKN
jgi:hypothetical protein